MGKVAKLSDEQVQARMGTIPGWSLVRGKLHREFIFGTFIEAFGFMTRAALVAESMNHHPEWFNVYQRVIVDMSTHSVGGISDLDFTFATRLNELAG